MPLSTLSADNLLNTWGSTYGKYASLHSAYSATGANELTGGSPAYARLATTWGSAASNAMAISGTYTWNVPAGSTVAFIGFWDALTSGNFEGMVPLGAGTAFAFAAPSSTDVLLAPGSAYAANATVCVFPTGGSALPAGLSAGVIYFVKSPSGDSFELAATSGGSAINLTADGSGYAQAITAETFASQGTYGLGSSSMSLV